MKIVIHGNPAPPLGSTLILCNHRTRLEWLFLMSYQLRCASLKDFRISLKAPLKKIPGPGNVSEGVVIWCICVWVYVCTKCTHGWEFFVQRMDFHPGKIISAQKLRKIKLWQGAGLEIVSMKRLFIVLWTIQHTKKNRCCSCYTPYRRKQTFLFGTKRWV